MIKVRAIYPLFFLLINFLVFATLLADDPKNLEELELELKKELSLLNIPPPGWVKSSKFSDQETFDVVIVGGGMSGMAVAFALLKEGVDKIKIIDLHPRTQEGCWPNYARMKTLRSDKKLVGPALGIPSLTFWAWYEAQYGKEAWLELDKIPTQQWIDYLIWYRQILNLPVENCCHLDSIEPKENCLALYVHQGEKREMLYARKIVLATGMAGFGGLEIPPFVHLNKNLFAHSAEFIDFECLSGKHIGVLGCGASAFDAAVSALEHGAAQVSLLFRRQQLPQSSAFEDAHSGFTYSYYRMDDQIRWNVMCQIFNEGVPPPYATLTKATSFSNFSMYGGLAIRDVYEEEEKVIVATNQDKFSFDFLILGTGFKIDGRKEPLLERLMPEIMLWEDRFIDRSCFYQNKLNRFPYLGLHFQFLERNLGKAPYLKNLYCFNYAAVLSHGFLSSDIEGIGWGAERLARGIACDLFMEDCEDYFLDLDR